MASFVQVSAVGFQNIAFARFDFDSKAMRKVSESDSIVVTLENANSAHAVDFILQFRMLVKLHG